MGCSFLVYVGKWTFNTFLELVDALSPFLLCKLLVVLRIQFFQTLCNVVGAKWPCLRFAWHSQPKLAAMFTIFSHDCDWNSRHWPAIYYMVCDACMKQAILAVARSVHATCTRPVASKSCSKHPFRTYPVWHISSLSTEQFLNTLLSSVPYGQKMGWDENIFTRLCIEHLAP